MSRTFSTCGDKVNLQRRIREHRGESRSKTQKMSKIRFGDVCIVLAMLFFSGAMIICTVTLANVHHRLQEYKWPDCYQGPCYVAECLNVSPESNFAVNDTNCLCEVQEVNLESNASTAPVEGTFTARGAFNCSQLEGLRTNCKLQGIVGVEMTFDGGKCTTSALFVTFVVAASCFAASLCCLCFCTGEESHKCCMNWESMDHSYSVQCWRWCRWKCCSIPPPL